MPTDPEPEGGRFRRLGRRLLGDDPENPRSFRVDAKEVLHSVLEGGNTARTELVRIIAKEVRMYFEELGLKEDLHKLLTNYSFEVKGSVHLRRLPHEERGGAPEERAPPATASPPTPVPAAAAAPAPALPAASTPENAAPAAATNNNEGV